MNWFAVAATSISMLLIAACSNEVDSRRPDGLSFNQRLVPTEQVSEPESPTAIATPEYCETTTPDVLHEVLTPPSSPYFIHHPATANSDVPTVIFLPGGSGRRASAERVWRNFLSEGEGVDEFRIVIPYSVDTELMDDVPRIVKIREEVLACFGGDSSKVHIAGTSNGGHIAFFMMLTRPQLFATLLGAPGEFPTKQPERWVEAIGERPVFNGVGANDADWIPGVFGTHEGLASAGGNSVYVEFAGQGHQVGPEFDESIFFEFWTNQ